MENLPEQFAGYSPVEQQATVDAASFALLMHEIWRFTEGQGGTRADAPLCEAVLALGERNGITPFPFLQEVMPEEGAAEGQNGSSENTQPNPNDNGEKLPMSQPSDVAMTPHDGRE